MTERKYVRTDDRCQSAERTIHQFAPLINKYAFKFQKRVGFLSRSMDIEDIKQELSITFLGCVEKYDENGGASFTNYVITSWYRHINRLVKADQDNMDCGSTVAATVYDDDGEAGECLSLFDRIDSGVATPEQNMECLQTYQELMNRLSAPAKTLVDILLDPPDTVVREFNQQLSVAQIDTSRNATERRHAYRHLSLPFLLKLFDVPRSWGQSLTSEIKVAADAVTNPA